MDPDLARIQDLVGYRFARPELLAEALTHRSYTNEHPAERDNERLEFLGDAVLSLVVSDHLLAACHDAREGGLSRRRARLVNTAALARVALGLGLGDLLRLGRGEQSSGGAAKRSLLADALEALIGAVYLDGGLEQAAQVVHLMFGGEIERVAAEAAPRDYKSELQELLQRQGCPIPSYEVVAAIGPDHQKHFVVLVRLAHQADQEARGEGRSKKQAEQEAARAMLERLSPQAVTPPDADL